MRLRGTVVSLLSLALSRPAVGVATLQQAGIRVESADGFLLAGRYYATGATGPGVVLLHQCDREGSLTGYEELAPLLAERGMHVLELDFRGFGHSRSDQYPEFRGNMRTIAPRFPADVEAAYRYLIARPSVDSGAIAVVGASCGASQAIFLAQRHESVKALVLLSGSLWPGARSAFDDLTRIPIFVATSEGDRVTESMTELFSVSEAPNSQLRLYKGDLHGTPLFGLDARLTREIAGWLSATLGP